MITMLWGAGIGLGFVGIVIGLRPAQPSLARAQQLIARHGDDEVVVATASPPSLRTRLLDPGVRLLGRLGLPGPQLENDLHLADLNAETFLTKKVFAATAGLFMPMIGQAVFLAAGVMLPPLLLLVAGLVCAAVLFVVPDREIRARAAARRAESRYALEQLLSFTSTSLAAGDGIESALEGAATIGSGPAFAAFRQAGTKARMSRRPIWDCYGELGRALGLTELEELAVTVELAGGEGARIADSLSAKSAAIRGRMDADRRARNVSITEKMQVPVGVMLIGFLAIMAFPAMDSLLVKM